MLDRLESGIDLVDQGLTCPKADLFLTYVSHRPCIFEQAVNPWPDILLNASPPGLYWVCLPGTS